MGLEELERVARAAYHVVPRLRRRPAPRGRHVDGGAAWCSWACVRRRGEVTLLTAGEHVTSNGRRRKKGASKRMLVRVEMTAVTLKLTERDGMLISINACIFLWYFT